MSYEHIHPNCICDRCKRSESVPSASATPIGWLNLTIVDLTTSEKIKPGHLCNACGKAFAEFMHGRAILGLDNPRIEKGNLGGFGYSIPTTPHPRAPRTTPKNTRRPRK